MGLAVLKSIMWKARGGHGGPPLQLLSERKVHSSFEVIGFHLLSGRWVLLRVNGAFVWPFVDRLFREVFELE